MWRNPKYANEAGEQPDSAPGPPAEKGHRLATLPRPNRNGPREELRVVLDEFEGHEYIAIRIWTQGSMGSGWFPTRKGCSVRLSEAEQVADALNEAVRLAESEQHDQSGPRPGRSLPQPREGREQGRRAPAAPATGRDFDEFG